MSGFVGIGEDQPRVAVIDGQHKTRVIPIFLKKAKGAAHRHICSSKPEITNKGAAHRNICSKTPIENKGTAPPDFRSALSQILRCAAPYFIFGASCYKYYGALHLL